MATNRLILKQDEQNPVSNEVLAEAVVKIAAGVKRLNSTPLNRLAVVVLVSANTGVSRSVVTRVLNGLDSLEATYLKKKTK